MSKVIYKKYLDALGDIPEFLLDYLQVPSLLRLKKVCYFCGMDYASKDIYDFKEKITRYDHSLSVALLTWRFTKNNKATIAALFHDVATPCFAHVIDYMNKDYAKQDSTEELTRDIISNDDVLKKLLDRDSIKVEEIYDFKRYSIVDNERPKMCADRFDGLILTGYAWVKEIKSKDILEMVNSLDIYINEDKEEELGFKNILIARKAVKVSEDIDVYCHSNEDNYMMELLADITRKAIDLGIITYNDLFYLNEQTVIRRIEKSENIDLQGLWKKFISIKKEDIPITEIFGIKKRILRPIVLGKRIVM